jgi:hypothetical protein
MVTQPPKPPMAKPLHIESYQRQDGCADESLRYSGLHNRELENSVQKLMSSDKTLSKKESTTLITPKFLFEDLQP